MIEESGEMVVYQSTTKLILIVIGAAPISIAQVTLPVPVRDLVEEIRARYDIPNSMDA